MRGKSVRGSEKYVKRFVSFVVGGGEAEVLRVATISLVYFSSLLPFRREERGGTWLLDEVPGMCVRSGGMRKRRCGRGFEGIRVWERR